MRGIKRAGGCVLAAAAMAGAGASPAQAMIMPACAAVINPTTGTGSCTFDTQWDYTLITAVPVKAMTVRIRCVTNYGYVTDSSRTVTERTVYTRWTPGACTMTLTGTAGVATATATIPPIIDPPPPPMAPLAELS